MIQPLSFITASNPCCIHLKLAREERSPKSFWAKNGESSKELFFLSLLLWRWHGERKRWQEDDEKELATMSTSLIFVLIFISKSTFLFGTVKVTTSCQMKVVQVRNRVPDVYLYKIEIGWVFSVPLMWKLSKRMHWMDARTLKRKDTCF